MDFTPLTAEQRAAFERDGYLIVRNAIDRPMIDSLIAAGDRLIQSDRKENRQSTADGLYDGFRNCVTMDDAFIPLMTNSQVVPLVVQLMGPNLHLFTSHLIYKHADPAGTPVTKREPGWHRDIAGVDADLGRGNVPRLDIKCAYYLTDLSKPNFGATLVSPGSHKLLDPPAFQPGKADPENVLEPLLQPGDCLLFENRTWHAASVNLSGYTRKTVMFGYTYRWMKAADFDIQPEEFLAKLDPIGQQLNDGLKDANGKFIPGGISAPLREWCKKYGVAPR